MYPGAHLPNAPYGAPDGAVVHAWRSGHWYTWMFEVNSFTKGPTSPPVTTWTTTEGQNNIFGKIPAPKIDTDAVKYLGTFGTAAQCFAACNNSMVSHVLATHACSSMGVYLLMRQSCYRIRDDLRGVDWT
jgi:hypothetical protein